MHWTLDEVRIIACPNEKKPKKKRDLSGLSPTSSSELRDTRARAEGFATITKKGSLYFYSCGL